ncbi:hypothetical protein [Romboutsia lituseburensis]|uniref:hypothetical protein n=1 Tax=Romboutsia lituseburensis TaxID=1537 RepID=UPI00215AB73E|nr:hypothetical protein [Romboutsia lituseburensis]MCR8744362.1 hypothetical protein [Romboutsia lituseburensis]
MILELEDKQFEEIRDILGSLFLKSNISESTDIKEEVIRLSQWVDHMVVSTQNERQVFYEKYQKERKQ